MIERKLPKVSIVIPVYNGANYLKDAIDSSLSQTYPNVEVIVVNDGSSDGGETERIALSYGNRIRYFNKKNGGVASALNLALRHMEGEYFSWLSHDDIYYPKKIETQIRSLLQENEPTRIVINDYNLIDENGVLLGERHFRDINSKEQIENSLFSVLHNFVCGCAMLIHKSHFERVGLFDETLKTSQDYDMWFRIFRGQRLLHIPESLTAIRTHSEQGSRTISTFNKESAILFRRFMNDISDSEIESLYGYRGNFYLKMCDYFVNGEMLPEYEETIRLMMELEMPREIHEKLEFLREYILYLSNQKAKRVCIFCAGKWGVRLYRELFLKLIRVDFFCDNDKRKIGKLINGVKCISIEELKDVKDDTLVIVSTIGPNPIVNQLKENGFPYVVTNQEIFNVLQSIPPLKWLMPVLKMGEKGCMNESESALVNQFGNAIFEMCAHYEGQISRIKKEV